MDDALRRRLVMLMPEDEARLQRVCEYFLHGTCWAGELGDPVPRSHRASVDRRYVTELRHTRRVCREIAEVQ